MALNAKYSHAAANAAADAVAALFNNGYLRVYDGSQPTDANTALGSQVLLAELRFANPTAFASAVNGVATANPLTGDPSANATGTASWFRALKSDGTTVIADGSVGAGGTYNLVLDTTSIVSGAPVDATSFTLTQPES